MLRKLSLILLLLVSFAPSHAMEAAFAHAIYYLPDPIYAGKINPYVEAYWQVNPKKLRYNTDADKKIIARILTVVTITNDTGHLVKEDRYIYETKPSDNVDQLAFLNILEMKRYFLATGKMTMKIRLTDLNDSTNVASFIDTFTVSAPADAAFYGGVEFIDTSFSSEIRTPFRKHGKQYIPWCEGFFETYKNRLNYYTELYQTDKVSDADFPLVQSVFISKKKGEDPFTAYMKIDTITNKDTKFVDGGFSIVDLPSGNYYLNFLLGDKLHQTIASKSLFFQRMNTRPVPQAVAVQKAASVDTSLDKINVLDLSKTFLKKYDEAHITAILKMILPIADRPSTRAIEGFLKKPEDMYMRYFIYNHFLNIDPQKPEHAWKEYSDKVKEANKLYNQPGKPGYETPRGFMYLRYGAPSEVVNSKNETGSLPYEVWQYNNLKEMGGKIVTNAVMLFYKTSDVDTDFKLLHTNIGGEIHNMGWRTFLYTSSDGGSNMNSRAEQYIGTK